MSGPDLHPVPEAVPDSPEEAARLARRRRLATTVNPGRKHDYLTILRDTLAQRAAVVTLTYVPGKLLIRPEAFTNYLAAFDTDITLEALALEALDDINNEIVPRWVEVRVEQAAPSGPGHQVIVEDREPKWDNPALLARLR